MDALEGGVNFPPIVFFGLVFLSMISDLLSNVSINKQ
jgi:hypothetical protein